MGQDHESAWLDDLCWLLSQASHNLTTRMTAALENLDLAPRAHMVLAAATEGQHSQIELARLLGLDKTTMVATVDELEEAGLAERRPSPTDRRARIITVTRAGTRTLHEADRIAREVRDSVLSPLALDKREALLDGLRTMLTEEPSEPTNSSQTVRRKRGTATTR